MLRIVAVSKGNIGVHGQMTGLNEKYNDTSTGSGSHAQTRGDAGGEDSHSDGVEGRGGSPAVSSRDVTEVDASVQLEVEVESDGAEEPKEVLGEMLEGCCRPVGSAVDSND